MDVKRKVIPKYLTDEYEPSVRKIFELPESSKRVLHISNDKKINCIVLIDPDKERAYLK